jgi:hypothetical protein
VERLAGAGLVDLALDGLGKRRAAVEDGERSEASWSLSAKTAAVTPTTLPAGPVGAPGGADASRASISMFGGSVGAISAAQRLTSSTAASGYS